MIINRRYHPEVLQVVPGDGFLLYIYFSDGSIHRFDAEPILTGEVFAPLRDPERFRSTLTVLNGPVAWDLAGTRDPERCVDLDPWVLYRDTPVVAESALRSG